MYSVVDLIKEQVKNARDTFESTAADIKPSHLHKNPGGLALPLGATYAHLIFSEDMIVQGMLQGKAPLFAGAWKGKTGVSRPMPSFESSDWPKENRKWSKIVKVNLPQLRKYSQAVYKATDKYLASLKEKDLKKEKDLGPMGKRTISHILSSFLIGHTQNLAGEIAVLKGVQGARGYPF